MTIIHRRDILIEIVDELTRSRTLHSELHSTHEGYAVILEEVDELWDEVRKKEPDRYNMRKEAIQIAAMALKFIEDIIYDKDIVTNGPRITDGMPAPDVSQSTAVPRVLHHVNGSFTVGSMVKKKEGYAYLGDIVSIFTKKDHQVRVVVEATQSPYGGMLHIYSPDDLEVVKK